MDQEITRLRQALAEAESRALDEQRRREEEQRRREEEQRRREEAEDIARASLPQTLEPYLEACHTLSLAVDVVTDRSLTTQGDTTNPVGRIYPQRIIPWDDFPSRQEEIWNQLFEQSFTTQYVFPSQHQLDYVRSLIRPISSEHGLRYFERDTVENAVQKLIDTVYDDPSLRDRLGLRGTVTFESHTNLGTVDDNVSESLERVSLAAARRPPKGKGNRADQFCIYGTSDGANIPATAIEYKAPHKLSQDEIVTGLESEIQPARDVINKNGEGFAFASKALAAAVVTQLFSYMIGKGIQYGYVCTGQAFVFLYIPDDPTTVFYYVCVPNLDVLDDDEDRLHRTAVAQVFAFILQALRTEPPPLSWYDAAADLSTWAVEYEDVLSSIPETTRKERRASPYKPQRWRGFRRSPIRTRSRCQQPDTQSGPPEDDDDGGDAPPSPTPGRPTRARKAAVSSTSSSRRRGQRSGGEQQGKPTQASIRERPYCTHQCLLGLAYERPMDETCPNAPSHGSRHIARSEFLRLLRAQLAEDRGPDADSAPLYQSGSVGSLFKIRLSAYGYTLVAKGVEAARLACLRRENGIYDQIRDAQGKHAPVCLGMIDLVLPYYYDGGVFKHFLLLSWAGRPLSRCIDVVGKTVAIDLTASAYAELHRLRILHRDAEPRNILYDSGNLMIIDFERAESHDRQPLGLLSPNGQNRKRKRGLPQKQGKDEFTRELQSVVESVSRCFGG
ncbi:hypothetical protein F5Y13DRAFT_123197 [Hypoxylon sp. FL1857]|nr:hypothetical protein F5Y13DRAFT_123197 [Hypoxylon sp. FL1857]